MNGFAQTIISKYFLQRIHIFYNENTQELKNVTMPFPMPYPIVIIFFFVTFVPTVAFWTC